MSEDHGARWVGACKEWTGQAVLGEIHRLASAAASEMGSHDSGGDRIRVLGRGPIFTVEALWPRGVASAAVQFGCGRTDGNQLGEPNCIVATSALGHGNEPTKTEKTAHLALDCASGTPCLLVDQAVDGREMDDGRRQVTVEEFVREVLLPLLFPALVGVDHSRDESNPSARGG